MSFCDKIISGDENAFIAKILHGYIFGEIASLLHIKMNLFGKVFICLLIFKNNFSKNCRNLQIILLTLLNVLLEEKILCFLETEIARCP